ncbi:hypothetical protein CAPTEDRAFT_181889 [Capitella teleta]|uniref:Dual specificity protein phosphatase 23 n=1 Tax=Capitella teleta TaxID=283909 RepID=R7V1H2_CAPTE|nr:hypothetical protein CAPTEDRAFT_181889 [Capitella teleta]|eukprot:ELU12352.1 hypothetical protein CAPTEDRAFT_181889 [Capitella teleta]
MPPHPQRPANFSWVIPHVLAGSAFPHTPGHFEFLKQQNIQHVVTLTEWAAPKEMAPPTMQLHHIVIEEFSAPTLEQIEEFVRLVDNARQNNERVLVHCYWGRGRTGTMLAAYLVKTEGRPPMQAVNHVRQQRPYSVETYEQEEAVIGYAEHLLRKQATSSSNDEPR